MALFLGISFISIIAFIYSLVRHLLVDFTQFSKYLYRICSRLKRRIDNRRKLQAIQARHLVEVRPKRISLIDSIKKRRELLLKLRFKDSDAALDVENIGDDDADDGEMYESNTGSLYEFLN